MSKRAKTKPNPVAIPTENLPYPVLLHRIRHGITPRPGHCRSYGSSSLHDKAIHGFGYRKARPIGPVAAEPEAAVELEWEQIVDVAGGRG